jgi:protein TonB
LNQRQGFLVSAIAHVVLLSMLAARLDKPAAPKPDTSLQEARAERVFLPPRAMLRQLLPQMRHAQPAARAPQPPSPQPPPTPPPSDLKNRISVGAPSTERKEVLELRREDDLTRPPKGTPNAIPSSAPRLPVASPDPGRAEAKAVPDPGHGSNSLVLPRSEGSIARGAEGPLPGPKGHPLTASLERVEDNIQHRLGDEGLRGTASGVGNRDLGALQFDPEGADFTSWLNAFKNELYRNWLPPQAFLFGAAHGEVEFEFTVERDGHLSSLRLLKSSGTAALDRAAENALRGSRFLTLPADYAPPHVVMQLLFTYSIGTRQS